MKKIKQRIPEGGAIVDNKELTMEQYSEIMKKQLSHEYQKFAANVVIKINPLPNSTVLEIGPGPGWAGISLLKRRKDLILTGLEASPDMIRVASQNAKSEGFANVNYIQGIAEDMKNIPDNQFDVVISRDSMHHWTEPQKVFSEIKRILKPNGKLYIHDSRRDLDFKGNLIVKIFSLFLKNNMGHHWKASIAASYTPYEVEIMLKNININNWTVNSTFMDLSIVKN